MVERSGKKRRKKLAEQINQTKNGLCFCSCVLVLVLFGFWVLGFQAKDVWMCDVCMYDVV